MLSGFELYPRWVPLKHELSIHVHVHAKILSSHIARLIEVGREKNKVNHWQEIEDPQED